MLSREWKCSWSSADRHYIWVIDNLLLTRLRLILETLRYICHTLQYWLGWPICAYCHNISRKPVQPRLLMPWLLADITEHHDIITHWAWRKIATISQMTFSNGFSWIEIYIFRLRYHSSLFPRVQLTIFQHWFSKGLALSRRQAIIWTNGG